MPRCALCVNSWQMDSLQTITCTATLREDQALQRNVFLGYKNLSANVNAEATNQKRMIRKSLAQYTVHPFPILRREDIDDNAKTITRLLDSFVQMKEI